MVWKAQDWTMYFMGNGYMNSDWGLMGGYPSATGYRFEAHKTDQGTHRVQGDLSLPLGADRNPDEPNTNTTSAPRPRSSGTSSA